MGGGGGELGGGGMRRRIRGKVEGGVRLLPQNEIIKFPRSILCL